MTRSKDRVLSAQLKECTDQALRLSSVERALLAERLIESLDSMDDAENERLWVREAQNRYQAYKKGKVPSRPAEMVLRDARKNIK